MMINPSIADQHDSVQSSFSVGSYTTQREWYRQGRLRTEKASGSQAPSAEGLSTSWVILPSAKWSRQPICCITWLFVHVCVCSLLAQLCYFRISTVKRFLIFSRPKWIHTSAALWKLSVFFCLELYWSKICQFNLGWIFYGGIFRNKYPLKSANAAVKKHYYKLQHNTICIYCFVLQRALIKQVLPQKTLYSVITSHSK